MRRYIFKIVFQVKGNNDYMGAPNQKPSQRLTLAKDFQTKNRFKKLTWLWIFKPKTVSKSWLGYGFSSQKKVSKSWLGYGFASQKPFQKVDLAMDFQNLIRVCDRLCGACCNENASMHFLPRANSDAFSREVDLEQVGLYLATKVTQQVLFQTLLERVIFIKTLQINIVEYSKLLFDERKNRYSERWK